MSQPTQTIAAPSFANSFSEFSPSAGYSAKPFSNLFVLLVSLPKTGKSCFLESNPDLLRIDFDRAGTTNPETKATTIPALKDAKGNTVVITKAWLDKLIDKLIDLEQKKLPRPKTICFDTVDKMTEVLCADLAEKAGVQHFYELDIKTWGTVYNQIADYCNTLVQHGYGLWLTSHIINKRHEIGERAEMMLDLTLRDSLLSRIRGGLDLILAVEKTQDVTQTPIYKLKPGTKEPLLDGKGKPMVERLEVKSEDVVDLVFSQTKPSDPFAPNFSRLVCARIRGLPERIRLPRTGAWQLVETQYEQSAVADGAALLS